METATENTNVEGGAAQAAVSVNAQVAESTKQAALQEPAGEEPGVQEPQFNEEQKAYIAGLRAENAKWRTKYKDLEGNYTGISERFTKLEGGLKGLFGEGEKDLSPEEQIQGLSKQNENLNFKTAVLEAGFEYGVGKDSMDYFSYLIEQKASSLEEGEELTEEDLMSLAQKAKGINANTSTSVGGGENPPEAPVIDKGVTFDKFITMSLAEKSLLFQKDPETYKVLAAQARKDGKLI